MFWPENNGLLHYPNFLPCKRNHLPGADLFSAPSFYCAVYFHFAGNDRVLGGAARVA